MEFGSCMNWEEIRQTSDSLRIDWPGTTTGGSHDLDPALEVQHSTVLA